MSSSRNPQEALIFRTFLLYGALIGMANFALSQSTPVSGLTAFDLFQLILVVSLLLPGLMAFVNKSRGARWASALNDRLFRPRSFWWGLSMSVVLVWIGLALLLAFSLADGTQESGLWANTLPAVRLWTLLGLLGAAYLLLQAYVAGRLSELLSELHMPAMAVGLMLMGGAVRLLHLLWIDPRLPYTAGGLFLEFSRQISVNGYRLPEVIPYYSQGGIPFAYPPLGFIAQAILLEIDGLSPVLVGNLFPPLISLLTLPYFYVLVREWRFSRSAQLSALLVYALMPGVYQQQVESQGTAEVFGTMALLFYGTLLLSLWRKFSWRNVLLAGLGWALAVCASPGSGYYSILLFFFLSAAVFWRTRREGHKGEIVKLVVMGGTALFFSALWYWGPVVQNHGFGIFLNAFSGQHEGGVLGALLANLARLGLSLQNIDSPLSFYWNVFILIGVWAAIRQKRWGLLGAFLLAYLIPRENTWLAPLPGAVLGGLGLAEGVLPAFRRLAEGLHQQRRLLVFALLTLMGFYFTSFTNLLEIDRQLVEYDRDQWAARLEAYSWGQESLSADAQVLALTHEFSFEWAPFLMERTVLNVFQGLEWQPEEFADVIDLVTELPECLRWSCVTGAVESQFALPEYYIFLDGRDYPLLAEYLSEQGKGMRIEWKGDQTTWLKVTIQD